MSIKETKRASTAEERIAEALRISEDGGASIVFDASEEVRKARAEMFAENEGEEKK